MDIALQILSLFGGLGMFLFGMNTMSSGLERAAGDKLRQIMEKVTGNLFKSVILGAVVAALTQSSSATTVMVVGFVNAGILTLSQAVGIIMGANIGTTITAWILSLNDLPGDVWYLAIVKPTTLAPVAIILGAGLLFFCQKKNIKTIGEFLVGLGLIFIGMEYMSNSMEVVFNAIPSLQNVFAGQNNPVIGILIGTGITAIIQSSAASVAMLQAVASSTAVVFSSAFPIIMGQNIGTCVTALLSSVGASKNAKRAAMIHLYFNIIGTIVFMVVIYALQYTLGLPFWHSAINATDISIFHSIFNVASTIMLLPFSRLLVWLAQKTIKDTKHEETESPFALLDDRFLSTPSIAINNVHTVMSNMCGVAKENVMLCRKMIKNKDMSISEKILANEELLDEYEINLTAYLTKVSDTQLSQSDNEKSAAYFHLVNNIERIGDYCDNIRESIEKLINGKIQFSPDAEEGLKVLFNAVENIMELTFQAFTWDDISLVCKIEPLEEVVDGIQEKLERKHMKRLKSKKCSVEAGVIFLEIISNVERISDHCSNIGVAILQARSDKRALDRHEYLRRLHAEMPGEYREDYEFYKHKYAL